MSAYIDLVKAKIRIKKYGKQAIDRGRKALDPVDDILSMVEALDKLPTANVEEVRHAYWKRQPGKDPEAVCSHCGREAVYQIIDGKWEFENFCPHCGARMDGKGYKHNA